MHCSARERESSAIAVIDITVARYRHRSTAIRAQVDSTTRRWKCTRYSSSFSRSKCNQTSSPTIPPVSAPTTTPAASPRPVARCHSVGASQPAPQRPRTHSVQTPHRSHSHARAYVRRAPIHYQHHTSHRRVAMRPDKHTQPMLPVS